MENFEKENNNIDGEFHKIKRAYIDKADDETQNYFEGTIPEDVYQDPSLDEVFDKNIFNNKESEIIRSILDKKYLEKIANDLASKKDLLVKLIDCKNELLVDAGRIVKKINETESKLERDRLISEVEDLKAKVEKFKEAISGLNEEIPLSEKSDYEETDPFYFSQN